MKTTLQAKSVYIIPAILAALMIILACNVALQGQTVKGVINGRSAATMTLQTLDTPKLVVLLTPIFQLSCGVSPTGELQRWPHSINEDIYEQTARAWRMQFYNHLFSHDCLRCPDSLCSASHNAERGTARAPRPGQDGIRC